MALLLRGVGLSRAFDQQHLEAPCPARCTHRPSVVFCGLRRRQNLLEENYSVKVSDAPRWKPICWTIFWPRRQQSPLSRQGTILEPWQCNRCFQLFLLAVLQTPPMFGVNVCEIQVSEEVLEVVQCSRTVRRP